jgi:hypothetical protein
LWQNIYRRTWRVLHAGKHGWCMTLTTYPLLVPRLRKGRSSTSSPPKCHRGM